MRLLKLFFFGITGLFVFATLLSLLIPFHIKLSRVVLINAPADRVMPLVNQFNNWKKWHPLFKSDSAIIHCSGSASNSGQSCSVQYINRLTSLQTESIDSNTMKFLVQSKGENDIQNEISFHRMDANHVVEVEWIAIVKLHWYPWEKLYGIFMDRIAGPGYEAALDGLKKYAEIVK